MNMKLKFLIVTFLNVLVLNNNIKHVWIEDVAHINYVAYSLEIIYNKDNIILRLRTIKKKYNTYKAR